MVDEFGERYGDLLTGSYDCVDRIVLNAYSLGNNPGGFRVWWRRLHEDSDELLDNNHLMRFAGRFARRVRAWAQANGVPVIDCKSGERNHRIAEEYLATHAVVGPCVFLVLVAKAPATVWDVPVTRQASSSPRSGRTSATTRFTSWTRSGGAVALMERTFPWPEVFRALGIASHWPFEQWGRFLPEHVTATSLLDRLLHHATVVVTEGESFRMREARTRTTRSRS